MGSSPGMGPDGVRGFPRRVVMGGGVPPHQRPASRPRVQVGERAPPGGQSQDAARPPPPASHWGLSPRPLPGCPSTVSLNSPGTFEMDVDNAQGEARFLVFTLNRNKTPLRFPVASELSDVAAGVGVGRMRVSSPAMRAPPPDSGLWPGWGPRIRTAGSANTAPDGRAPPFAEVLRQSPPRWRSSPGI